EREQGLLQSHYRRAVEEHFSPEFINRLDDVVCFDRLGAKEVAQIVDLELEKLFARLAELGVECEVTGSARHMLATEGYNSRYGARALRRVISERVETAVAQMIVEGRIAAGSRVVVDAADEIFVKIIAKQTA
ncbi:MAG: ATP-dependent Clp protease ATP-binding subunit, partial [Tidjanibacter sp.]|nr:ATP-dependent Clp protease ATP-binding subunit [Tidjanibacter sp.]